MFCILWALTHHYCPVFPLPFLKANSNNSATPISTLIQEDTHNTTQPGRLRRKRNPTLLQPACLDSDMTEPRVPVRMDPLCCTICHRVLRNPVTIPCRHNFCMRCIQDRWDHDERTKTPCSCPECGFAFPSRPRLNETKIRTDLPRDSKRPDPGGEKRKQQHSGASVEIQKRPRLSTQTGSPLCGKHRSSLDVYCCTDEQILCAVCASAEHSGHTIGLVKEERKRKQVLKRKDLENTAMADFLYITERRV